MREIKFRAWDKWNKIMIQPNNGDFIGWHAMSNWKDCLELMQFTGLHDKNGKEIFEGDILHSEHLDYEVKFINNEYYTGVKKVSGNSITDLGKEVASKLEVIGNIWENPELLEGKEKGA